MEPRVMVMAGGTGGHVFPALAVAEYLRDAGMDVFWLGTPQGLESELIPRRGFRMEWINVQGLRGSGIMRWLQAPLRLLLALSKAYRVLRRMRPTVVLGMGGFVAGPGGLMARLLGIPLVIHEQNAIPGLTNKFLSRIATRVFEAFPGSFPQSRRAYACGNPVRPEILALAEPTARFAGRSGPLQLLVLGGSQGARALNETLPLALAEIAAEQRPRIRHQAGGRNLAATRVAYENTHVAADIIPFMDDMAEAYAWADLVVCRAGALTISELAAAGVGAILVPYPHAVDDHQTKNAGYLVDAGAALLLPESQCTAHSLLGLLRPLLADRSRLANMAQAARALAHPHATVQVAQACLEVQQR